MSIWERLEEELQNLATVELTRDVDSLHHGLLRVNHILSLVLNNQKDIMSALDDFNAAVASLTDAVTAEEQRDKADSTNAIDPVVATKALLDLTARVNSLDPAPVAPAAPVDPTPAPAAPVVDPNAPANPNAPVVDPAPVDPNAPVVPAPVDPNAPAAPTA